MEWSAYIGNSRSWRAVMPLMITDVCLERVLGIERLHGEWLVLVCCDAAADDH